MHKQFSRQSIIMHDEYSRTYNLETKRNRFNLKNFFLISYVNWEAVISFKLVINILLTFLKPVYTHINFQSKKRQKFCYIYEINLLKMKQCNFIFNSKKIINKLRIFIHLCKNVFECIYKTCKMHIQKDTKYSKYA